MSTPKQLPGSVYAPDGSLYITLTDGNGNLATAGGSSTITAGTTVTSGITSGNLIGSSSNLIVDSGVAYSTLTGGPFLPLTGGTLTGNLTSTPSSANTENLTLQLGTLTANTKAINITGTFNSSGTTFDAPLFMNITNTASAAGSLLADIQVGGSSVFTVNKAGYVSTNAIAASNWLSLDGTGALNQGTLAVRNGEVVIQNAVLTFNSGFFSGNAANIALDGANLLALVNGTNANSLRVYNTSSSSNANYERGVFGWTDTSNVLTIGTQAGGTGIGRNVQFVAGGTTQITISESGVTIGSTLIATGGNFDLGNSGTVNSIIQSFTQDKITLLNHTGSNGAFALQFAGTTSSFPSIKRNGTALNFRLADDSADAPITAGAITSSATVATGGYTVSTLPAAGTAGRWAYVTDATAPSYLGTLTGGGSVVCPVFDNGSAWVSA